MRGPSRMGLLTLAPATPRRVRGSAVRVFGNDQEVNEPDR
jgi:hypothetical protein